MPTGETPRICGRLRQPETGRAPCFPQNFDGSTGHACGASHLSGWAGLVALLLHPGVYRDAVVGVAAE